MKTAARYRPHSRPFHGDDHVSHVLHEGSRASHDDDFQSVVVV